MPTLELKTELSKNDLLKGVEQLESVELDEFIREVLKIKANRQNDSGSLKEDELVLILSHNLNKKEQIRYNELINKRKNYSISDEELLELIEMNDLVEQMTVERTKAIIELAKLKKVSTEDIIERHQQQRW